VAVVSATQITATFDIGPTAALGATNVTVTTGAGTSNAVAFTVNPPVAVAVTPATASLYASQTQQFTATVTNAGNTAVTWSMTPNIGAIGATGLYTAPATIASQQTVTVTATSAADPGKSAWATVTLNPGTPPPSVSVPNAPAGPTAGIAGTLYQFAASGAVSSLGDLVQYSFNWGDGAHSGWTPNGVSMSFHAWSMPGVYTVTVQARSSTQPAVVSAVSAGLTVTIGGESISAPTTPAGPASGVTGTSCTFATGGAVSSLGHTVQYNLIWGDGSYSGWLPVGTTSASHSWPGPGTFTVTAQARCATDTSVLSPVSSGAAIVVTAGETISTPAVPGGPTAGAVAASYTYSAGGAVSSAGNPVVFLFDWGDGTTSGWLRQGVTTASHAWSAAGSYAVTVYAADANYLLIQSAASGALTVRMQ
jgi:hypothetical protein